jgi:DNA-binding MarR family transcriptional regulator
MPTLLMATPCPRIQAGTAGACASPPDVIRVANALRALVRVLRLSDRAVERALGISGAQLFVLEQLEELRVASVNELAERTSTDQSSVSTVVSRLAEHGFVTRRPAWYDRRRLEVSITQRGRDLLAAAPETAQARIVAALQRSSSKERAGLAHALAILVRRMGLANTPVPMDSEDGEPREESPPLDPTD